MNWLRKHKNGITLFNLLQSEASHVKLPYNAYEALCYAIFLGPYEQYQAYRQCFKRCTKGKDITQPIRHKNKNLRKLHLVHQLIQKGIWNPFCTLEQILSHYPKRASLFSPFWGSSKLKIHEHYVSNHCLNSQTDNLTIDKT